ncbi:MAG: alpha/beta hydrolase [Phycisphaerae bacterium]|nr:alpha/beta hydrolase [Phycisphaerae bacterium]
MRNWIGGQQRMHVAERLDIEPIEQANGRGYSAAVQAYFAHYRLGLAGDGGEHLFGSFPSGEFTLAGHLYRPAVYRATVVLIHGYLNHSGQFKNLIHYLLGNGFAVGVFDLPGHGLSSGEAAAIESFDQYTQAVDDFVTVIKSRLHGPFHAVGFSLGGAILMDLLLTSKAPFEKNVLAAPLIHWSLYEQSKGTYSVYSKFTDRIARFHQKNSSDRDYLIFNRTQDFLHCTSLSLRWVKALFDWNDRLAAAVPCAATVLVVQGDKDGTVEWEYNIDLVKKKFPNANIEMIVGARHELFNEADIYRSVVLEYAGHYLAV